MKITHTLREYIIEDGDSRYSVRVNTKEDYWGVWKITERELADVNSVEWFEVSDELLLRIKSTIKEYDEQ